MRILPQAPRGSRPAPPLALSLNEADARGVDFPDLDERRARVDLCLENEERLRANRRATQEQARGRRSVAKRLQVDVDRLLAEEVDWRQERIRNEAVLRVHDLRVDVVADGEHYGAAEEKLGGAMKRLAELRRGQLTLEEQERLSGAFYEEVARVNKDPGVSFAEAWRIAHTRLAQLLPEDLLKRACLTPAQREEQARIDRSVPQLARNAKDSRRRIAARDRELEEATRDLARLSKTCVPQQRAQRRRPRGSQRRANGNVRPDQATPPQISTPSCPESTTPAAEANGPPAPEPGASDGEDDDSPPAGEPVIPDVSTDILKGASP